MPAGIRLESAMNRDAVLSVENLVVKFGDRRKKTVHAVSGIDFQVFQSETLGLVGESGCGKSSTARAIMQLPPPVSGRVIFQGQDLTHLARNSLRRLRPRFQMIFQDSVAALNPRKKIGDSIGMPLAIKGRGDEKERRQRIYDMMAAVGLARDIYERKPFELSGGQCQRIQIARALMAAPDLLICDEPVSSLDVSVQAQILNLLEDMRLKHHLTMLFISHDLAVVKNVCDRVAVMYLGKLCEIAPSDALYRSPLHPYTSALLQAIPDPEKPAGQVKLLPGEVPSPTAPPSGCRFRTRCPASMKRCAIEEPRMTPIGKDHRVACHLVETSGNS